MHRRTWGQRCCIPGAPSRPHSPPGLRHRHRLCCRFARRLLRRAERCPIPACPAPGPGRWPWPLRRLCCCDAETARCCAASWWLRDCCRLPWSRWVEWRWRWGQPAVLQSGARRLRGRLFCCSCPQMHSRCCRPLIPCLPGCCAANELAQLPALPSCPHARNTQHTRSTRTPIMITCTRRLRT